MFVVYRPGESAAVHPEAKPTAKMARATADGTHPLMYPSHRDILLIPSGRRKNTLRSLTSRIRAQ